MADGKGEVPALFGIDPDCLYKWTPRDGREEIEPAKYEGEGAAKKMVEPAKYGAALPDAPVVVLVPLTEAEKDVEILVLGEGRAGQRQQSHQREQSG